MKKILILLCVVCALLGVCYPPEATPKVDTVTEVYKIGSGTRWENEVHHLKAPVDGPSVYLVAGIHGDEEAAWQAGNRLKELELAAGEVYILSPANPWGAEEHSRYVTETQDINRFFPGDLNGKAAKIVAATIYQDIQGKEPILVMDLHEAHKVRDGKENIGNSFIFTEIGEFGELLMDIVSATQDGDLCHQSFDCYGPAPSGSLNAEVSTQLEIPVITVETYEEDPMELRIENQIAVVEYVLQNLGLLKEV